MTMTIIRQESSTSREGNPEIFCQVEFSNEELGTLHFAKWLSPIEIDMVSDDPSAINAIMESCELTAIARKREELAYLESLTQSE